MKVFRRKDVPPILQHGNAHGVESQHEPQHPQHNGAGEKGHGVTKKQLPRYNTEGHQINHAGHKVTRGIQPDGESGRSWFHPWHFVRICFRSSCTASKLTNFLWPFAIAAMVMHFCYIDHPLWVFVTSYIGMVPAANLVGFGGQELARKIPKVTGVILETTFGSIVEIILFMVLIVGGNQNVPVIRAAILGSILANVLFCLGSHSHFALRRLYIHLHSHQEHASLLAASSGRTKPSTRPSAKSAVTSCLSPQVREPFEIACCQMLISRRFQSAS